jgi:nucleoporin POM152
LAVDHAEAMFQTTPRLRSMYPPTPDSRRGASEPSPKPSHYTKLPPSSPTTSSTPILPVSIIDAPSQRFYIFAIYIVLLAWRLYDWGRLVEDEVDSFWLFIKWVAIDGVFLFGLPGLRIPWLEWSNPAITGIFLFHALLNGLLMFRVPVRLNKARLIHR